MSYAVFFLGVLGLAAWAFWRLSLSTRWQAFGRAVRHVPVDQRVVALTFDDGPTPRHLPGVLDLLAQEGVVATFFLTGREMDRHPVLARQIVKAGHEVGNHSWHHTRMIGRSARSIGDELSSVDALIREAGQSGAIPFRPPYGQKMLALPWVLSRAERPAIMWDVEAEAGATTPEDIVARVLGEARPGSIILMHIMYENRAMSRAALPGVIAGLRDRGYRFVTVTDLLARR